MLRVEPVDHDWRTLIPDGRIEVPGEVLAGCPDASSSQHGSARTEGPRPEERDPPAEGRTFAYLIAIGEPIEPVAPRIGTGL